MTGYDGYFMSGLASGLQSGMDMGAKMLQLKWAKEEKEKAEKANQEMIKALSNLNNSLTNSGYYDSIGLGGNDLKFGNSAELTPDLKYDFNNTSTPAGTMQPAIGNDLKFNPSSVNTQQTYQNNPVNTMNPDKFGLPKVGSLGVLASPEAMKVIAIGMTLSDAKASIMADILLAIDKGDRESAESKLNYYKELTGYVANLNANGISVEGTIAGLKNILPQDQLKRINAVEMYGKTPDNKMTPGFVSEMAGMSGFSPETIEGLGEQPAEGYGTPLSAKDNMIIESYKKGAISFDNLLKYMGAYIEPEKATAKEQEIQLAKQYGATNEEIKNMLVGKGSTTGEEVITADDVIAGKLAIITPDLQEKLKGGMLDDKDKSTILANYNRIKETLTPEVQKQVEDYLKQLSIFNIELGQGQMSIPSDKNKDYTTMSEDELYNLAEAGNMLAYAEAKRRGLVK
jgi:hypothetical protein